MIQLLVNSEFYIKNIYLSVFSFFLFFLFFFHFDKSDKQIDTTNSFNK